MTIDLDLERRATLLESEAALQRHLLTNSIASLRETPVTAFASAALGFVFRNTLLNKARWLPLAFMGARWFMRRRKRGSATE